MVNRSLISSNTSYVVVLADQCWQNLLSEYNLGSQTFNSQPHCPAVHGENGRDINQNALSKIQLLGGENMSFIEQRQIAQKAWHYAFHGIVEKGCTATVALETMGEVAFKTYADQHGAAATVKYLRLLAKQIEKDASKAAALLISG
jgi:hypothetical protein